MYSLLLIEPHWEGHNMLYAGWVAGEAISRGYDVSLATHSAFLSHPFYRELQSEHGDALKPITIPGGRSRPQPGIAGYKFRYHRMFSKLYRGLKRTPDGIFVPYLDYCTHAVGLLGSPFGDTPWGGIVINPDFHLRPMGIKVPELRSQRLKEALFFRLLRDDTLKIVFTLDELLIRYAEQIVPDRCEKIHFLPEPFSLPPLPSLDSARERLGISRGAKVILAYGILDHSKGLDALLRAVSVGEVPENVVVLIAGPQTIELRALLSSPEADELRRTHRLYEWNEFLYGEKEAAVFAASDIVWIGYRGQHISSGVLIQAGAAGRPVIACDEGLIGWYATNKGLGIVVNIEDPDAVVQAISTLASDEAVAEQFAANGLSYAAEHTSEKFRNALGAELVAHFPMNE